MEQATVELVAGLRAHARRMLDYAARTLTEAEAVLSLADNLEQREGGQ